MLIWLASNPTVIYNAVVFVTSTVKAAVNLL